MTNAEFADKIGVRPSTVSMWMRGTNSPRMELLDKIADLFGISVSDLMTDTNSSVIRQDLSEMYEMLVSLTSREDIQPINHVTAADLSTMHSKFLYYTKLLQDLNPDELNDVKHYIEFVKSKRADTENIKVNKEHSITAIDENAINKNRLKAIYDGMISHYKSVPKFARTTTKYIAEKTIQYRQLMEKSYSSYTNFFFVVLKELTGDLCSSLEIIKNSKNDLDNAVSVLCKDLKHVFCKEFAVSPACKLSNAFCELYKSDWINKRVKAFDYYTNAFLDYAGKAGKASDIEILYQLGKILTGIEIEYWNDNHRIEFEERLFEINGKLSSYTNLTKLKDSETKMTLTASTGEEKTIIFDNTGLSDLGITIKNKINSTFGNFGLSVTYEDKVQILLALLNDLMEGK